MDKPSGVVVHRGWAGAGRDDLPLLQRLRDQMGCHVFPVHRLDRGASGVVLFALDAEAAAAASRAFGEGTVDKRYVALTRGHPPTRVTVDHAIPRAEDGPRVPAVTDIGLLERLGRYALVEAIPHTGRLHQIRRHLKHLSCPILGDVRYGKGDHNRFCRERHGLHRLALHACSLTLPHPFLPGESLHAEAPLPADLQAPLGSLRDAAQAPTTGALAEDEGRPALRAARQHGEELPRALVGLPGRAVDHRELDRPVRGEELLGDRRLVPE